VSSQDLTPLATLNFYYYAADNPVRYIDSRGESVQDQVKEWLKVSWEYAMKKLKELYEVMSRVAAAAKEALGDQFTLFQAQGLVLILALQFMGMQLGSPGMPNPGSELGTLVADWQANPGSWKIAVMNTSPAAGTQYRGGTSVKIIFQRLSDGAVFGYHAISMGARIAHAHFASGVLPVLLRWLMQ
jgi:hypothetical protein